MPGALLGGRYRIVGLLGRGGMGEVYRADDLKLGETVALKLLPEDLSRDGAALARLHKEVKVARRITHKNVGRMYDIGEVDGLHFLSMEYVDGEDLASLLRRVGRLPPDRATAFARQVCAGLAAAHGEGVLHRDLKPANVMVDGQGRAKIMDFGLAGMAEELQEGELAGTPAYMAPEQLEKGKVSFRSDIYSLGLILYETFTGRRPFEAGTRRELMALHRSGPPSQPSSIVSQLDLLIEQTLMRCLEAEPSRRPRSALEVAASLPGGDPMAAALRAGVTPSPEMVAAAPEKGTLGPGVAVSLFLAIVLFLGTALWWRHGRTSLDHARLDKSPEVLADRAATLIDRLAGDRAPDQAAERPFHQSSWWLRPAVLDWVNAGEPGPDRHARLDALAAHRPALLTFWHQRSPEPLFRQALEWRPDLEDPPLRTPGMVRLELDPVGRLLGWWAVPRPQSPGTESPQGAERSLWTDFFDAAGLEIADFSAAEPRSAPFLPSDMRQAWRGSLPDPMPPTDEPIPVRVEAASFEGQPVYFAILEPWDEAAGDRLAVAPRPTESAKIFHHLPMFLAVVFIGSGLAWRHLRSGRGDRRGTSRLMLFVFGAELLLWLLGAHHGGTIGEFDLLRNALSSALFAAAFVGVAYLALEPFLRRYWPEGLISWTRFLGGNVRDPLVGRDVLLGCFLGSSMVVIMAGMDFLLSSLGQAAALSHAGALQSLVSARLAAAVFIQVNVIQPLQIGLAMTVIFLLAYLLLRRKVLAWAALTLFIAVGPEVGNPVVQIAAAGLLALSITRFGLLTTISMLTTVWAVAWYHPITLDLNSWFAGRSFFVVGFVVALSLYGLRTSVGGQALLPRQWLDQPR